nr:glycoside hydrolase family 88 protein [Bacillus sp. FJAT-50079]
MSWSIKMADTVLRRYLDLSDKWDHEYGIVFKGIEDVWHHTGDCKYIDYLLFNIGNRIGENGEIAGYELEDYSVDHINSGRLLFPLFEETKEERFKKAAFLLRQQLETHPRTSDGIFWHKQIFPYQGFLDGVYMGDVFYAQFAKVFNDPALFDDVTNQILLFAKHNKDEKTGLFYQGYDEKRQQIWANADTGCSSSFWGRAIGWYCVGIVDILDYLPEEHAKRQKLIEVLSGLLSAIVTYQEPETGVWYQVVDQGGREGNYLESSSSCMYVYALAKAIRQSYVSQHFLPALKQGYNGILNTFIDEDERGIVNIHQTCQTAGLGITANRDGSFEYYISEPIVSNDFKGIGTFIMASVQVEKLIVQMDDNENESVNITLSKN